MTELLNNNQDGRGGCPYVDQWVEKALDRMPS